MANESTTEPKEPNYNEYEVKFYPVDKEGMRELLVAKGAILVEQDRILRSQLFHNNKNPNMHCDYARVRDEGKRITLSTKTHAKSGKVADQFEVGIEISNFDNAVEMLKQMGLVPGSYHEHLRETWNLELRDTNNIAEVVIDTWPGLPSYIEIEAHSEEEVQEAATILGFDWENKMIAQVIDIYAGVYGVSKEEALARMDFATFDHPPYQDYEARTQ